MQKDKQVFDIINKELERQRHGIELIASENFTSLQVIQAMGTVLTNKYAEGYPGKRYYGGCEFVDETEQLAIDWLKKIFDCEYANVQPHSGAQANIKRINYPVISFYLDIPQVSIFIQSSCHCHNI